ncbi:MAG: hypothetical protein J5867_06635 [Prevotella sp.]|nr:hypothetical protein [Prevotella sp.]
MKRVLFSMFATLLATTISAQQIAVVDGSGQTSVYYSLDEAIESATDGCTIYLPSGGFQVKGETRINKRVTIMGIGHRPESDNADVNTIISGDVNFAPGSDGSAIMGVYMSNNLNIGTDGSVKNILVKYCNINEISVKTDSCSDIEVNQNYIRGNAWFAKTNARVTNNIMHGIGDINGGIIMNNLIIDCSYNYYERYYGYHYYSYYEVDNSTIINNIQRYGFYGCDNCIARDNWEGDITTIINKWNGISTTSDFHFNDTYEGDTNIGIYGGTGFSDDCLPPMPRITSKNIAEQTDEQGKLKIQVTVKNK